eukprot:4461131-Pyramimonas_sp.AAC.1
MTREFSEQERSWRGEGTLGNRNVDYHIMRIKRLSRAWKGAQRTITLRGIIDQHGHAHDDPGICARILVQHRGQVFDAPRVDSGPGEEFLRDGVPLPGDEHQFTHSTHQMFPWIQTFDQFQDLLARRKHSAPGPDGLPRSARQAAGPDAQEAQFA